MICAIFVFSYQVMMQMYLTSIIMPNVVPNDKDMWPIAISLMIKIWLINDLKT